MEPLLRQAVDLALVAGEKPPPIARSVAGRVSCEDLRRVVLGVDRDRDEPHFGGVLKLPLELRELEALRGASLRALGIDEVDDPDEAAQVVAPHSPAGALHQRPVCPCAPSPSVTIPTAPVG